MCNDKSLFVDLRHLSTPQEVTLGDGSSLEGLAEGTVKFDAILPSGNTQKCSFENALFVPKLSYSLLSVSKASECGKTMKVNKSGCQILNQRGEIVASATRVGNLYYLSIKTRGKTLILSRCAMKHCGAEGMGTLGSKTLKAL